MSDKNAAQAIHEQLGVTTTITLLKPVTLGDGRLLEKLTVRAMTIGDVRSAAHVDNDILRELHILTRLTGLVPEDLDMLGYSDYKQLQNLFRD